MLNTKKIAFAANNETKEIEVQGVYPYLTSSVSGKVVLRISANEADATFDDLHALADNTSGIIEQYERTITVNPETSEEVIGEWELKTTYTDYESGKVSIAYNDGVYNVEVTRIEGMVKETASLRADVDYIAIMSDIPLV